MNNKRPNGYWVQQLTDANIADLLEIVVSKKKTKKFKKVIKQTRTDDTISILYESKKINCYLTYAEDRLIINDYKIQGGHSYMDFYEFMIETFGEAYADDFMVYANDFIAQNPEDKWSNRLKNVIAAMPAIVDSHKHNTHNEM